MVVTWLDEELFLAILDRALSQNIYLDRCGRRKNITACSDVSEARSATTLQRIC